MADAMLTFHNGPSGSSDPKAVVCFECKFTSDISTETKYHYARNQIARIIDIGISRYPNGFFFVLVTSSIFKNSKSRVYSYKMREYQGDMLLGSDLSDKDLERISAKVGWLTWEDLAGTIFRFKGLAADIPFEELERFYKERILFPEHILSR